MNSQWTELNQKYLVDNIRNLKLLLKHAIKLKGKHDMVEKLRMFYLDITPPMWSNKIPSAIDNIVQVFNLSEFEKLVLLLCAGIELDSEISYLCSELQDNGNTHPTFALVLNFLPKSHWSALSPLSPLRRFRLVSIQNLSQLPLSKCPLRIDERILHYLTGVSFVDSQIIGLVKQVRESAFLVDSYEKISENIFSIYKNGSGNARLPHIHLLGIDSKSKVEIARRACEELNLGLWYMDAEFLSSGIDLDSFITIWSRESVLIGAALYVDAEELNDPSQKTFFKKLVDNLPGIIFVGLKESMEINHFSISYTIPKPTKKEQEILWSSCFDGESLFSNPRLTVTIRKIVSQFNFDATSIMSIGKDALFTAKANSENNLENIIWQKCRDMIRSKMSDLTEQIIPRAKISDLILPNKEKETLAEMASQVNQRNKVYDEWGFGEKSGSRGLGITALFAGQSGTGKTMAAEVLAHELKLDLFRIDLSTIVSKYIGETEKNLSKVFDAAEDGGMILFFDEADALFAKRTEVKNSIDRYANLEVGYLLQRMEEYTGIAILATNMINSIDSAILRRIRFIVTFPFPNDLNREQIWGKIFPTGARLATDFDVKKLSKMNIAGGNIRNIALNAAFIAADRGVPINMSHLKRAAKMEYDKMGRTLTDLEF